MLVIEDRAIAAGAGVTEPIMNFFRFAVFFEIRQVMSYLHYLSHRLGSQLTRIIIILDIS